MIVAGSAAIAAASVEMTEQFARLANRPSLVLFLDVHMKRIEVQFHRFRAHCLDEFEPFVARVQKVRLEPIERLDTNLFGARFGVLSELLEVLHHQGPFQLLLRGFDRVGLAHDTVNRTDERRAIQHNHLVDERLAVIHRGLLVFRRAAKVPARPHAGADRTAHQPVLVQLLLHQGRIDVRQVFNGYFDCLKAPFFERFEKFRALVGEGRSEQKRIDAKSHNGFFDRLVER